MFPPIVGRTVPRDELRLARGRVLPVHLSGQPLSRMARALRLTPGQLLTEVDRERWTRDYSLPRHLLGRFGQKPGAGGGQASGKTVPRRAPITLVTSRYASVSCLKMSRPGVNRRRPAQTDVCATHAARFTTRRLDDRRPEGLTDYRLRSPWARARDARAHRHGAQLERLLPGHRHRRRG